MSKFARFLAATALFATLAAPAFADARDDARADLKRFLSQRQLSKAMVDDDKALLETLCDKEVEVARALALCKRAAESHPTHIHAALEAAKASTEKGEALAAAVDAKVDEASPQK
jgi:hypothetical protein